MGETVVDSVTSLIKAPSITAKELLDRDSFYADANTAGLELHEAPLHAYRWQTPQGFQYAVVIEKPMGGHEINQSWYAASPNKDRGLNTYDIIIDDDYIRKNERLQKIHQNDLGQAWLVFAEEGSILLDMIRAESSGGSDSWKPGKAKLLPSPVWTNNDDERCFQYSRTSCNEYETIADQHALETNKSKDHSALHRVLGVQAVAALAPEITGKWPKRLGTPSGKYEQFMGPLQTAVAALFTPAEWAYLGKPSDFSLVHADLLGAVEQYVSDYGRDDKANPDIFSSLKPEASFLKIPDFINYFSSARTYFFGACSRIMDDCQRWLVAKPQTRADRRRQIRAQGGFKKLKK